MDSNSRFRVHKINVLMMVINKDHSEKILLQGSIYTQKRGRGVSWEYFHSLRSL